MSQPTNVGPLRAVFHQFAPPYKGMDVMDKMLSESRRLAVSVDAQVSFDVYYPNAPCGAVTTAP